MFVYWTYVLEGEEYAEFSFGDRALNYLQKISDLPLNTKIIKQTHKTMMEDEKLLVGEHRKSPASAGYHTFAPASHIERWMEDAIFRFHETKKKMIQLWPLQICLETSICIHLKMGMKEFVAWFWYMSWYRWNAVYFQSFWALFIDVA